MKQCLTGYVIALVANFQRRRNINPVRQLLGSPAAEWQKNQPHYYYSLLSPRLLIPHATKFGFLRVRLTATTWQTPSETLVGNDTHIRSCLACSETSRSPTRVFHSRTDLPVLGSALVILHTLPSQTSGSVLRSSCIHVCPAPSVFSARQLRL